MICINSFAQNEWAPIGAKWYYSNIEGMMPPKVGYVLFESKRDSIIKGVTYRVIIKSYISSLDSLVSQEIELTRAENSKVYSLFNNKEYLLYDFNLAVGDTFQLYMRTVSVCDSDSIYLLKVDSIGQVIINQHKLNYQCLSAINSNQHGYNLKIYERIGCSDFMFPFPDTYCIVDNFEPGPLRCYSDSVIGVYNRLGISCDSITNINDLIKDIDFFSCAIYPNPVNKGFYFKLGNTYIDEIINIKIYDLSGLEVFSINSKQGSYIDISQLSSSVYILNANVKGKLFYNKLIKY